MCIREVAHRYSIPPLILGGVLLTEHGQPGAVNPDPNGTDDYGPMQINSVWLPVLATLGIGPRRLADDGCLNVLVGGAILALQRQAADGSLWTAIGWYHSRNRILAQQYRRSVMAHVRVLLHGNR
ncbi:MAG: lytic transglycosylase domain-containing protein [Thermoplasmataceae archaeon]